MRSRGRYWGRAGAGLSAHEKQGQKLGQGKGIKAHEKQGQILGQGQGITAHEKLGQILGQGQGITAHEKLGQGQEQEQERRILLAGSSTQTVRSQARITEQQLMMNITSGTNCILKRKQYCTEH
jgi:hypothetical protein